MGLYSSVHRQVLKECQIIVVFSTEKKMYLYIDTSPTNIQETLCYTGKGLYYVQFYFSFSSFMYSYLHSQNEETMKEGKTRQFYSY